MCCLRFDVLSDRGGFHVNVIKNLLNRPRGRLRRSIILLLQVCDFAKVSWLLVLGCWFWVDLLF